MGLGRSLEWHCGLGVIQGLCMRPYKEFYKTMYIYNYVDESRQVTVWCQGLGM